MVPLFSATDGSTRPGHLREWRWPMAGGNRSRPARTDYPFEIKESLQLLDDGKHVLAADQYSIWLLELRPEPARASGGKGDNNSTASEP